MSAGSGSVVPARTVTKAVLTNVPVAAGSIVAVNTNVTVAPTPTDTVVSIDPLPDAVRTDTLRVGHARPLDRHQSRRNISVTRTLVAFDGPALVTVIV